jgi:hypothetical protein
MRFDIEPHVGIAPIRFGMNRAEVVREMTRIGGGSPVDKSGGIDCFFNNGFQVSYRDGTVEFIEVYSDPAHTYILEGVDVFDTPADQLVARLATLDSADSLLSEQNSYCFPSLIVSLWEADEQYDCKGGEKRPIFGAVGVGDARYLAAIRAIHSRS